MLFGNGLSALLTLMAISAALVVLFVVGPLVAAGRGPSRSVPRGWMAWLAFFGALGAGFMLIEVAVLQRFVLLLGHPVYSLTVTLFSLLLGTGLGAAWSRRFDDSGLRRTGAIALALVAVLGCLIIVVVTPLVTWAIPFARADADGDRRRHARAPRRRAGAADADGAADARREGAADDSVGMGHQRRAVGRRRDARDFHRHELGLQHDAARRVGDLPDRIVRISGRDSTRHAIPRIN